MPSRSDFIGYCLHFVFGAVLAVPALLRLEDAESAIWAVAYFAIGVEWMQQLRALIEKEGQTWPSFPSIKQVVLAFWWQKLDRYLDVLSFALGAAGAAFLWEKLA